VVDVHLLDVIHRRCGRRRVVIGDGEQHGLGAVGSCISARAGAVGGCGCGDCAFH
jgi:hypothetical protein